jgi:UDP-N-acetylmuramoyl-tripeptide--D-alanyl-D-alanine ligase
MNGDVCFTGEDLERITGGAWQTPPPGAECGFRVTSVVDDSRVVKPGAVFIAIRGEFSDGHQFIPQAVGAGAAAVCVETAPAPEIAALMTKRCVACLRVDSTLATFQQLARVHRIRFPGLRVAAITGSSGKTSTKEMIASILEQHWPGAVLKTDGNTNNHFGVPRNLLRLARQHRAAVFELGTSRPGEIATLVSMVVPYVGVVSNIGPAHLEFLGDLGGVAREKGCILAGTASDGVAVYPAETEHADTLRGLAGTRRTLTFGRCGAADVAVEYGGYKAGRFQITLAWRADGTRRTFDWTLGGEHQALNAGAAAAAATAMGLSPDEIVTGLKACTIPGMRMARRQHNGVEWFDDAYNANPASVRAGIRWFAEITADAAPNSRMLILGDMRELGGNADAEHRQLLDWVHENMPDAELILVGAAMSAAASGRGLRTFPDSATARTHVAEAVVPGKCVFVKGSRGVRLERVFPWDAASEH